jgi:hypothetical protein
MSYKQILAALVLALCLALLLRLLLGERRRAAFDAWAHRKGQGLRLRLRDSQALWRGRRQRGEAEREAEDLIERARRGRPDADREGNVIRPRGFSADRRRDLH